MAVRIIVTLMALPGKGADLAEAFKPVMELTHQEKGCEQYQLFQAFDDADTLVLVERWMTQADLDAHLQAMQSRGASPMAPFRADIDPVVEQYEAV